MRPYRLALTGLLPVLLLAGGCVHNVDNSASDAPATEQTASSAAAAPTEAERTITPVAGVPTINPELPMPNPLWRTGPYELRSSEITADGPFDNIQAESMELSRVMPSPRAVDARFVELQTRGPLPFVESIAQATDAELAPALAPFKDQYQGGAIVIGRAPNDPAFVAVNIIARFDDPQVAEKAAQSFFAAELQSVKDKGGVDASDNGALRVQRTVKDSRGNENVLSSEFATHEEYMFLSVSELSNEKDVLDYHKRFNELAAKAVAEAVTHEKVPGYGTTPDYAPLDRTGLLRYTVEDPEHPGIFPRANYLNTEFLAGLVGSMNETTPLLKKAGIDGAAERLTTVFRAKDTQSASEITQYILSTALAQGATVYPEPQELPNTVCVAGTPDSQRQKLLACVMQVEDTVALARSAVRQNGPDEETVKQQLSQICATQIFKLAFGAASGGAR